MKTLNIIFLFIFIQTYCAHAQSKTITPDMQQTKQWSVHNRNATYEKEGLMLNAQPGDGVAKLKGLNFKNGTIEIDIKGKNAPGQSFVGVAFHGADDDTYDAVYFRPFNFKNPERNGHSVQYISHPEYTWSKLRKAHPEKYENPVSPVPNPDNWFHATIVVAYPSVKVYVNHADTPSLEIEQLSARQEGWIGLWVGNNSEGVFKNLKVISEK